MKLKDLIEQYGEYDVEEWFEIGTDGVADEKAIKLKKPKPKTVWDLEDGDQCIYIDAFGKITGGCLWNEVPQDERARDVGNIFLTKEEAEKDVERRKVETLLLKHGGRRWFKEDTPNYFIRTHENGLLLTFDWTNHSPLQGVIYFDTEKQAEKAIEEIGEERIRKALFEVR